MAVFARDILGGYIKKAFARDILGSLRRSFFLRRLRKFFLMVLVARDIYGRFSGGSPSVRHFSSLLLCGTFRYH